jgi:hypothetical protein
MVKCCVLFELRTEFLNILKMSVGLKGLRIQKWGPQKPDTDGYDTINLFFLIQRENHAKHMKKF